jgi:hydroxymethylglutaryl-CoA synthase
MHGILSWSTYLPYRRLDRGEISAFVGQGGGRGTRTVAGFDEDATTLAVEAARLALRDAPATPGQVLFGTTTPAYVDKTNATAVHAALRLPATARAYDLGASPRSAVGGLVLALESDATSLVVSGDTRAGLAGSVDEAMGGDAGAAFLVGTDAACPLAAELVATASVTDEFVERWRAPGELRTKVWDERFSEISLLPLAVSAWNAALESGGLTAGEVTRAAVAAPVQRVSRSISGKLDGVPVIDDLASTIGIAGAAHPGLVLASLLEQSAPGDTVALVSAADGADVLVFRVTDALATPARTIQAQLSAGGPVTYGKFLAWKGVLPVEPPRRPEPQRVSATAAARSDDWKFGFVGSRERDSGIVHTPPQRVSSDGSRTDEMDPIPLADSQGTIVTFTVDRLAYSPSPPIIFAVVDFDAGGRFPIELTDVDEAEVAIGRRIEMTFRRLFTADGIANYFWKGRLVRDG